MKRFLLSVGMLAWFAAPLHGGVDAVGAASEGGDRDALWTQSMSLSERARATNRPPRPDAKSHAVLVTQDTAELPKALRKYLPRARQGDADAQYRVAKIYEFGRGVPKDSAEALKWYRAAAEQGHARAEYSLGRIYSAGKIVDRDYAESAKWFRRSAEQGVAAAQSFLGGMYRRGRGVPKDPAEAARWYGKAARQGYAYAQAVLGRMYRDGSGVEQDSVQAYMWLELAIAGRVSDSTREKWLEQQTRVAKNMSPDQVAEAKRLTGERQPAKGAKTTPKAPSKAKAKRTAEAWTTPEPEPPEYAEYAGRRDRAREKWRPLAQDGDAEAQFFMAWMEAFGAEKPEDYAKAVAWYQRAAAQGHVDANYALGYLCLTAKSKCKSAERLKWLHLAAEGGHGEAQYLLGQFYAQGGFGAEKDVVQAYVWLTRAIATNVGGAWGNRDELVGTGMTPQEIAEAEKRLNLTPAERDFARGVDAMARKDYPAALESLRRAAGQGYLHAEKVLASLYRGGQGVDKDDSQAAKWIAKAAAQGDPGAQVNLGVNYSRGRGVKRDAGEAVRLYRLAAEAGHDLGQSNLARGYSRGKGVRKDLILAYMWATLADRARLFNKGKQTAKLAKEMTPRQVARAKELARGWAPLEPPAR